MQYIVSKVYQCSHFVPRPPPKNCSIFLALNALTIYPIHVILYYDFERNHHYGLAMDRRTNSDIAGLSLRYLCVSVERQTPHLGLLFDALM